MWYFTWILGLGFAVLFAVVNTLWLDAQDLVRAQNNSTDSTDIGEGSR